MKLARPNNKKKERLVYLILATVLILVFGVWAFQIKGMVDLAIAENANRSDVGIQGAFDYANILEEQFPRSEVKLDSLIDEFKLSVQEEAIKNQAKSEVAGAMIGQLEERGSELVEETNTIEQ